MQKFKMDITGIIKRMLVGRVIMSFIIVLSFFGVIFGIGHAMHTDTEISGDWKEILLLLLGALIGAFSKVIDHWFKDSDKDKILIEKMSERINDEV
jgi:predicted membrane-bound mannosyltransferase